MKERRRGLVLRALSRVAPRLVDSIEHESRSWVSTCTKCGLVASVWEMGGIRWKAAGKPIVSLRCPSCHRVFLGRLEKVSEPFETPDGNAE